MIVAAGAGRASRTTSAALGVVVVLVGLGARALAPEAVGGPVGDCLFAVLVVLLLAFLFPRINPVVGGLVALAVCAAIELSHLTDVPAQALERFPPARYVLGTTFAASDLAWYALGAAVGGSVLAVAGPRARWADQSLRHGRSTGGSRGGRRGVLVVVPLALLVATGGGVGWYMWSEADDLTAQLAVARATLDESEGRVADAAVLTTLAAAVDDAEDLLDGVPIVDRLPGDATEARERVERDMTAVGESRLTFALTEASDAHEALKPVTRRAKRVLTAADELRAQGQGTDEEVRSALGTALDAADGMLATTTEEQLGSAALAEVEEAAAGLRTGRSDVERATVDLMTAQDAVVCPYPDQVWFPEAGKLDPARLVAIPWAPGHSVRADLLDGLVELNDAYRAHFGENLAVNSAYRTYADQVEVYNPDSPNPLAAPPGCSNHGLGTAVDLSVGAEGFAGARYSWLKDNAERFGWTHPDWAGPDGRLPEPWHWQSVKTPTEY